MLRAAGPSGVALLLATIALTAGCALSHQAGPDASTDRPTADITSDAVDRVDVIDVIDVPDVQDVQGDDAAPDAPDVLVCDGGLICSGVCVNSSTDVHNCGGCGTDCTTLAHVSTGSVRCIAGACDLTTSCSPGFGNCDADVTNGCEADLTTGAHCGACGTVCGALAPMCALRSGSYVCVSGCIAPTADRCGSSCVDLTTDVNNCGTCAHACPSGPHSTATCTAHTCGITCATDYADCDGNPANGCEVNLRSDAANCGGCGFACVTGPNATATCTNFVCGLACAAGFGDCDTLTANGCEASLNTDPSHCGVCSTSCAVPANSARTCAAGVCGYTCSAGHADCDTLAANGCEIDVTTNPVHCGTCATACATPPGATATCAASTCGYACSPGRSDCDGMAANGCEITTATDPAHCGACATSCTAPANATPTCAGSACGFACNAGAGNCDGNNANGCETTFATDPAHCGSCAGACPALPNSTSTCAGGTCGFACTAGTGDCDAMAANGCESVFATDPLHCGGCGTPCPVPANATATCAASACGFNCNAGFVRSGPNCIAAPADTCPGAPLNLANGETQVLVGTTTGETDNSNGSCSAGAVSPDVVYTVTPAAGGTLTITLGAFYDAIFYVRSTCTTGELSCAQGVDPAHSNSRGSVTIPVTAATPVSIWVDGRNGASGQYALEVQLNVVCGDHALDNNEQCDDGNHVDGDGCHSDCTIEVPATDVCPAAGAPALSFGDGPVWFVGTTVGTASDFVSSCVAAGGPDVVYTIAPTVTGTLRATVYPTANWDTQVYARTLCTDLTDIVCANASPGGWPETITFPVMAGTRYSVYVDSVGAAQGPFQIVFEVARCGDGVLQTGEICDDGNIIAGDGCNATCQLEATCTQAESEPNPALSPDAVTLACPYFDVNAAITPAGDEDFFAVTLRAGQVLDARSFVGSVLPGSRTYDTVLEIYRGPLAAAPTNTACNVSSGALLCSDDAIPSSNLLSMGSFPIPADGTYIVRLLQYGNVATVPAYGLQLHTY